MMTEQFGQNLATMPIAALKAFGSQIQTHIERKEKLADELVRLKNSGFTHHELQAVSSEIWSTPISEQPTVAVMKVPEPAATARKKRGRRPLQLTVSQFLSTRVSAKDLGLLRHQYVMPGRSIGHIATAMYRERGIEPPQVGTNNNNAYPLTVLRAALRRSLLPAKKR